MWEHPCVACVGLIFFWHEGCFWFGCLLSLSSACAGGYPLDRGCAGAQLMCTLPERQVQCGWLRVVGPLVEATGCMYSRGGEGSELHPPSVSCRTLNESSSRLPLESEMAAAAHTCPRSSCRQCPVT